MPNGKWAASLPRDAALDYANLYNIGRETFLLPVDSWRGGWPIIFSTRGKTKSPPA